MNWIDDYTLKVEDLTFDLDITPSMMEKQSKGNYFVLAKPRQMIENYYNTFRKNDIDRIIDLGIFKGGSCLLYYKLFKPEKIVAIDYSDPNAALDEYITKNRLSGQVRAHYGVNQADKKKLKEIIKEEFHGKPVDLVIDDASHFLDETTASFNLIFPHLRTGGYYVIEDWAWAHWPGDQWQKDGGIWVDKPALTNLIFELVMLSASRWDLIESVEINGNTVIVKRGSGPMIEGDFEISKMYCCRGKNFMPVV